MTLTHSGSRWPHAGRGPRPSGAWSPRILGHGRGRPPWSTWACRIHFRSYFFPGMVHLLSKKEAAPNPGRFTPER